MVRVSKQEKRNRVGNKAGKGEKEANDGDEKVRKRSNVEVGKLGRKED